MNRTDFLARVREAAQLGNAYRVHETPHNAEAGYVGGGDDLCKSFAAEVNAVGGTATVVESLDDARQAVIGLLGELQPRSALCWQHSLLDDLELGHMLDYARITWHDADRLASLADDRQRELMLAAEIGFTSCDFAVAESGTLAMCSETGQERMASLLPPVHVAVVAESQIIPDLFDLYETFAAKGNDLPSNVALITGPSKTGDIELQLTTGVHGPGDWRVIVVRGA